MIVLNNVRNAIQKRARFMRTKAELAHMPLNTAIDLGLFKDDAHKTAYRVVYG